MKNEIIIPTNDFDYRNLEIDPNIDENCNPVQLRISVCRASDSSDKKLTKEYLIKFTKSLIYEIGFSNSAFSLTNIFSCNIEVTTVVIRVLISYNNAIEELLKLHGKFKTI